MKMRSILRLAWPVALSIIFICSILPVSPSLESARASGPWYVDPGGNDINDCLSPSSPCATINAAIGKASSGDILYIASGIYKGSGGEVVLLNKSLTLSGGWDAAFATQTGSSIIDGEGARRGITIGVQVNSSIDRFTVQNGSSGYGGGILVNISTLILNRSLIKNNYADRGGGIDSNGSTVTINNSSIEGNRAVQGGGTNEVNFLNNSTVSGNSAIYGGGIVYATSINSSTVRGNYAVEYGGGLLVYGVMTIHNSLVDGNSTSYIGPDCATYSNGTISSVGYNLISITNGCPFVGGVGDLTNIPADLGPLVGNLPFHPLLAGSPAIDAGDPAGCTDHSGAPLLTDERGVVRALDGDGDTNSRCDIGAFEYDPGEAPFSTLFLPLVSGLVCPGSYRDTFDDSDSGWPVDIQPGYTLEYLHTEYHMLLHDTQSWLGAAPGVLASNFSLSVEARPDYGYGTQGLLFGLSNDWNQFYSFEIDNYSGIFSLFRYSSGNWTPLAQGTPPFMFEHINKLKIEREGNQIRAFINGQLVAMVTDNTFTGSRLVGLITTTSDSPDHGARFDNFILSPINCTSTGMGRISFDSADPQVNGSNYHVGRP